MRNVGWLACAVRLCRSVVVMGLVAVAVVLGHQGAGFGAGGCVLMPLVMPHSLALRRRRPLCSLDLCEQPSLYGVRRYADGGGR